MVTKRLPKHVSSVMAFTFVLQLALVCLVDVVEIGVRAAIGQWTHFSLKFKKPRSWSTQQSQLRMYSKRGHVSLVSIPRNHTRNLMSPICNDCTQLRRSSTIPYSSYQQSRLITMYHILIHASNFDRLIDTQTTKDSLREILSKIVKLWQMKPDTQLSTNFTREFKTKANSTHPAPTNSSQIFVGPLKYTGTKATLKGPGIETHLATTSSSTKPPQLSPSGTKPYKPYRI